MRVQLMSHNVDKHRTSWHEVKPYHRGFESEVRYHRSPRRDAPAFSLDLAPN